MRRLFLLITVLSMLMTSPSKVPAQQATVMEELVDSVQKNEVEVFSDTTENDYEADLDLVEPISGQNVGTSKIVKHLFGSTDSSFLIVSVIIFLVFTVFLLVVPILVVILAIVLVVKLLRRNKGNDNEPDYIVNNDINMTENKKLYRSNDRVIAGVCGGLANYFGFDPTVIRVVFALLTLFTAFSGVLIYFILWLLMPSRK